jgi:hypothetical protein
MKTSGVGKGRYLPSTLENEMVFKSFYICKPCGLTEVFIDALDKSEKKCSICGKEMKPEFKTEQPTTQRTSSSNRGRPPQATTNAPDLFNNNLFQKEKDNGNKSE